MCSSSKKKENNRFGFGKSIEEKFWGWFEKNQQLMLNMASEDDSLYKIVNKVGKKLSKVGPIAFEFSLMEKDGKREFIISADGIKENIPTVERLIKATPVLERWNIIKFKQRKGFDEVIVEELKFNTDNISFNLKKTDKVNITLYFEEFKEQLSMLYSQLSFVILDGILGEFDVMTKVGEIDCQCITKAPSSSKTISYMEKDFDLL